MQSLFASFASFLPWNSLPSSSQDEEHRQPEQGVNQQHSQATSSDFIYLLGPNDSSILGMPPVKALPLPSFYPFAESSESIEQQNQWTNQELSYPLSECSENSSVLHVPLTNTLPLPTFYILDETHQSVEQPSTPHKDIVYPLIIHRDKNVDVERQELVQPELEREKVNPYRMVKGSGVKPQPSAVYPKTYGFPSAGLQKVNWLVQSTTNENDQIFTSAKNSPVDKFPTDVVLNICDFEEQEVVQSNIQPEWDCEKVNPYRMVKGSGVKPTPSAVYPRTYGFLSARCHPLVPPLLQTEKEDIQIFITADNDWVDEVATVACVNTINHFELLHLNIQPHLACKKVIGVRASAIYPRTHGFLSARSQKLNEPVQQSSTESVRFFTMAKDIPVNEFPTAVFDEAAFEDVDLSN